MTMPTPSHPATPETPRRDEPMRDERLAEIRQYITGPHTSSMPYAVGRELLAEVDRLRAELTRSRAVTIAYQSGLDYDDDIAVWHDESGTVVCLDEHLVQWVNGATNG